MPFLVGLADVAHFITDHLQTHLNRVCCFHFFDVFILLPKNLTI